MTAQEVVALRGTARRLSGSLRAGDRPLTLPVTLASGDETFAFYRPVTRKAGEVRLALPRWTPAGEHRATLRLPDGEQTLVLNVEPQLLLRFDPQVVAINGGSGATVSVTVTAINVGTGSIEIPGEAVVGLSGDDTLENAFNRALRAERKDGERLLDRIIDEWAGEVVGELHLTVESGAGVLDPDAERELTLVLTCPSDLKPEKVYEGRWNFAGGSLAITVNTGSQS